MREFKIGDTVKVIRRNYPHYDEFGCIIDFHNGNAVVYFEAKPFEGNKFMFQPADTKEYPKDSLKLVPSSWINRDYSSYFKSMDGEMTSKELVNELKTALNSVYGLTAANLADYPTLMTSSLIKRVIFSDKKTIILWNDGSKTMVSCADGEQLDPYMGFCAAFTKGFFGSKHQVEKIVKNADYQPSKKSKKKISEVLKQLREDDTNVKFVPNNKGEMTSKELSNALKQLQNFSHSCLNE